MKVSRLLAPLLIVPALTLVESAFALEVSPSDPNIQYMGRWDFSDPNNPTTTYGHSLKAWFTGTSVAIRMNQTGTEGIHYEYRIDEGAFQTVNGSGPMTFPLASGLAAGSHSLEFRRRLEASYGMSTFQGLVIDEGALLEAPDPPSTLQIEFIGDSITAGFGSEGPQSVSTNNINATWAAKLADKLGADRTTIARSGIGISIDVNGVELSMPKRYPNTHFTWGSASPLWDFSAWTADAVFILLGTNDYVFGNPSAFEFESAYVSFIQTVRGKYPDADIFVVNVVQGRTTPAAKWTQASSSLQAVVASMKSNGDSRVHFVDPGEGLVAGDFSDTTHPLQSGHEKMASNLFALVEPIIGTGSTNSGGGTVEPLPGSGGATSTDPIVEPMLGTGGASATNEPTTFVDENGNPVKVVGYDADGNPLDANGNLIYPADPSTNATEDEDAPPGGSVMACASVRPSGDSRGAPLLVFFGLAGVFLWCRRTLRKAGG